MIGRGRTVSALALGVLALVGASPARAAEGTEPRLLTFALSGLFHSTASHHATPVVSLETLSMAGGPPQVLIKKPMESKASPNPLTAASWSGDGNVVAFVGGEGKSQRIFVVPSAGGSPRPVPGTRGALGPVISPDGQTIAFSRSRLRFRVPRGLPPLPKGVKPPKTELVYSSTSTWLVDVAGGNARRLTPWRNGLDEEPTSFSPGGATLALTRHAKGQGGPQVVLADLAGGAQVVIAEKAEAAAISPDGTRVAYVGYADADVVDAEENNRYLAPELYVAAIAGGPALRLTHSRGVIESAPSWDPSGSRIAYVSARADTSFIPELANLFPVGNSVMQMNADGTCAKRVVSKRDVAFYGATWQPGPGREAAPLSC